MQQKTNDNVFNNELKTSFKEENNRLDWVIDENNNKG